MNLYSSFIHNCSKPETLQMAFEGEWINKLWYIHTTGRSSASKRKKPWMHTQFGWYFLLNESSKSKKVTCYMMASIRHSQKDKIIELEKGQHVPGVRRGAVWLQREKSPERILGWRGLMELLLTLVIIWIICVLKFIGLYMKTNVDFALL